jgi:hypothetical protein
MKIMLNMKQTYYFWLGYESIISAEHMQNKSIHRP